MLRINCQLLKVLVYLKMREIIVVIGLVEKDVNQGDTIIS